ncbi:MAG TPA: 3D domain-containing protein [Candidatus Hydrogenedentes bacterium]|jgi:3D (Asp-Asp-Asp) domain-containing protein|nr:MAG: Cell wall-binding protein YocH precursor [Candidatus Hydrogenedentes bacterium ADurb.Bin170]HNZ49658.1 3D domain-containing protein [Candidatus Hydrogenedentota bacterium]HOD96595.1 3D domain-containing protein [Candidatus Hydrogenedentota bacterium]HOH42731.1 3D domain-containing protein [Candidatus Hydrogenedentota bacterium]HOM49112.1 3D domain-containing protein [Candidatus Hydrogenedentota bacterium]
MQYRVSFGTLLLLGLALLLVSSGCATRPKPPRGVRAFDRQMEVTAYDAGKKSTNWKRNWLLQPVVASGPDKGKRKKVGITASGTKAAPGTLAADTNHYPFGTIMYIPGYGYGRVEDRGSAVKGPDRVDVFFKSRKEALRWGRQKLKVRVWPVR